MRITQDKDYITAIGGQLGHPNSIQRRTYDHLSRYLDYLKDNEPLFVPEALKNAISDVYRFPLLESIKDPLNRQLRAAISKEDFANLVIGLWEDGELIVRQEDKASEPRILCSLGMIHASEE